MCVSKLGLALRTGGGEGNVWRSSTQRPAPVASRYAILGADIGAGDDAPGSMLGTSAVPVGRPTFRSLGACTMQPTVSARMMCV
eukprot:3457137-Prymnesium_polylepis.1